MKNKIIIILSFIIGIIFQSNAQDDRNLMIDSLNQKIAASKNDSTKVKLLNKLSSEFRGSDIEKAIALDKEALAISKKINYKYGIAKSLNGLGIGNYFLGNYAEAILNWQEAITVYKEIGNSRGIANILSNMGAIYFNQSEYPKAMELYLEALKIAELVNDTLRIATVWQNIGAIHNEKKDTTRAIEAFEKAIPLFKLKKNDEGTGLAYLNLGECYRGKKEYTKATNYVKEALGYLSSTNYFIDALRSMGEIKSSTANKREAMIYLDSAYNLATKAGDDFVLARIANCIGTVYYDNSEFDKAISYYEQSKLLSLKSKSDFELSEACAQLVKIFESKGDFKHAFENQKILQSAKDSLFSIESNKKTNRLLFTYDLEKKENEISLLQKDKKIQEIEVEKQKGIRNMFIGGFAVVLLFSIVFFRQRNKVKREKKNVEKEKARSEELLLNILPEEVAEELKIKGAAEAKLINEVSVLFTDFKGFTALSEILKPEELVSNLNECFTAFDHIIQKNGMEKIKTIGDAYMAAGGLPTPNKTHAQDVVKAGIEIRDFMETYKSKRLTQNLPYFEIRIGIHTGPVVAGIVGVKKFSYDIWGDTVNTASRMESSGEPGKVNVSGTTYQIIKDNFKCYHRGKISAKGKGETDMYFVELKS